MSAIAMKQIGQIVSLFFDTVLLPRFTFDSPALGFDGEGFFQP